MLLNKDQIKQRGLVIGGDDERYENASYDVRVGTIITADGDERSMFSLPPQGIVRVISQETVRLPKDVSGFALVKTGLCNEGVLALNIGIVDPLFEGPVSSALINFGKEARVVSSGQVFLRLTFFSYDAAADLKSKGSISQQKARADNTKLSLQFFGRSFLDLENTTEEVVAKAFTKYKTAFLVYVPIGAILLAGLTFLLNFSTLAIMQKFIQPVDSARVLQLQETVNQQKRDMDDLKRENKELRDKLGAKAGNAKASTTR